MLDYLILMNYGFVFQESLVRSWKRRFDMNVVMAIRWRPCWWSSAWTSSAAGVYEKKGSSVCLDKPTSSKSFRMLSTVGRNHHSTGTCSKSTYSFCYEHVRNLLNNIYMHNFKSSKSHWDYSRLSLLYYRLSPVCFFVSGTWALRNVNTIVMEDLNEVLVVNWWAGSLNAHNTHVLVWGCSLVFLMKLVNQNATHAGDSCSSNTTIQKFEDRKIFCLINTCI